MYVKHILYQTLSGAYHRYLRKYRYAQLLVKTCRQVYNAYRSSFNFTRCAIRNIFLNIEIFYAVPFVKMSDYVKSKKINILILAPAESVHTPHPEIFPKERAFFMQPQESAYVFPEIYVADIYNAKVAWYSNLVITPKVILRHDLYTLRLDILAEEHYARASIKPRESRIAWYNKKVTRHLAEAAIFTDSCSLNYAHWLTEILPRIHMFAGIETLKHVPLLVDTEFHSNVLESLKLMVPDFERIIFLGSGDFFHVDLLHVTSPTGYVPFNRRTTSADEHLHGVFSPTALLSMRKSLQGSIDLKQTQSDLKIFLRRNSPVRSVINEKTIEDALVAQGFKVIEPEKLTFREQIEIFSQAHMVVGATGSAMANLIFCQPQAHIIILIPKFQYTSYWYWQNMASAVGNQVTYVVGERTDPNSIEVHTNFQVDLADVLEAIQVSNAKNAPLSASGKAGKASA